MSAVPLPDGSHLQILLIPHNLDRVCAAATAIAAAVCLTFSLFISVSLTQSPLPYLTAYIFLSCLNPVFPTNTCSDQIDALSEDEQSRCLVCWLWYTHFICPFIAFLPAGFTTSLQSRCFVFDLIIPDYTILTQEEKPKGPLPQQPVTTLRLKPQLHSKAICFTKGPITADTTHTPTSLTAILHRGPLLNI